MRCLIRCLIALLLLYFTTITANFTTLFAIFIALAIVILLDYDTLTAKCGDLHLRCSHIDGCHIDDEGNR